MFVRIHNPARIQEPRVLLEASFRIGLVTRDKSSWTGNTLDPGGGGVNGGDFGLRSPVFPDRMTLFRENLTPLFEGVAISFSDWQGSTVYPDRVAIIRGKAATPFRGTAISAPDRRSDALFLPGKVPI